MKQRRRVLTFKDAVVVLVVAVVLFGVWKLIAWLAGVVSMPLGQRQDGTEHHILKNAVALDLAGNVADDAAKIGSELL